MTDQELTRAAIEASGLSLRRFAAWLMGRDRRTVERWRDGAIEIPPIAREWLQWFLSLTDAQRRTLVALVMRR